MPSETDLAVMAAAVHTKPHSRPDPASTTHDADEFSATATLEPFEYTAATTGCDDAVNPLRADESSSHRLGGLVAVEAFADGVASGDGGTEAFADGAAETKALGDGDMDANGLGDAAGSGCMICTTTWRRVAVPRDGRIDARDGSAPP